MDAEVYVCNPHIILQTVDCELYISGYSKHSLIAELYRHVTHGTTLQRFNCWFETPINTSVIDDEPCVVDNVDLELSEPFVIPTEGRDSYHTRFIDGLMYRHIVELRYETAIRILNNFN